MPMSLQKQLKTIMKKHDWRVADLARAFGVPYTTVREWLMEGRRPMRAKAKDVAARVKSLLAG